jgi:carboxypeptidase family protein
MFSRVNSIKIIALVLITALSAVPGVLAQAIDGNLTGTVVDPSGAVVPNATVEITNTATGIKTTAKTGVDGLYRFNNIPVGTYDVSVTASGFAMSGLKSVPVALNRTATANVTMQVQGVTQEVAVVEGGATLDTTTSQLQSVFEANQIVQLPIIENTSGGNLMLGALNLALLSSGVASNGGIGQGMGPSVGGQRPMNNNFMIEGVDNNNKTVTGPLVYVPTDSTQEFSLLQNQYNSEFGHSTGGQFNTIVKSGTNEVHGSLYEYFQNRKLNALDQSFKRQGTVDKPRFDQNRFGGSVGFPIIKNKWFGFGNFEYAPLGQASTTFSPVRAPTAAGYALLDAMPALSADGTSGVSKTNLSVLKQFVPAAPASDSSTPVNGVSIPIGILPIVGPNYTNQQTWVASSDYTVNPTNQVRFRIVRNKLDSLDTAANLPAFWTTLPQRYFLTTAALYHTFSPTLSSETRGGYNRFTQFFVDPGLKFPGLDRFPNITPENDLGLNIGPDPNAPQSTVQNLYQIVQNFTWNIGKHTLKFGFDGRDSISPQHFIQRERGDYLYKNLESYLHDVVPENLAERNFGTTDYYGNQWATYLYAQDDWHILPKLSINLGLRWERTTVPLGMKLQTLNAISSVPGLIEFNEPKTASKNFAPRIGFAYSPGGTAKTSIRGGFGMAYDVIFDNVGSTAYPPQLSATVDAENFPTVFTGPFLAKGGLAPGKVSSGANLSQTDARSATSSFIPDQVLPYSIQWTLGVQQQWHRDYIVEVRYLGTRGVHLLVQNQMFRFAPAQPNRTLPTYLSQPTQAALDASTLSLANLQAISRNPILGPQGFDSTITWWPPIGNSSYHGLATQVTRRLSNGLQFVGAYTWSHNIDDSTATHFSTFLTPRREQDFMNLGNDRSTSALDRRHRFTLSWTYDSPWMRDSSSWFAKNLLGNWRFIGTYTYESPEFVTVQSGQDSNLNGDSAGDRVFFNAAGDTTKGSGVTALCKSSLPAGLSCTTAAATLPQVAPYIVGYKANDPSAAYITAGLGVFPNAGRNTLPTRPIDNFDLSFAKKFNVREGQTFEFRGDFGNFFNHPQYTPGYVNSVRLNNNYTTTRAFLIPGNPDFAKWDQVFNSNARSVQLVLRYIF